MELKKYKSSIDRRGRRCGLSRRRDATLETLRATTTATERRGLRENKKRKRSSPGKKVQHAAIGRKCGAVAAMRVARGAVKEKSLVRMREASESTESTERSVDVGRPTDRRRRRAYASKTPRGSDSMHSVS